jgi:N-acyl amino acid synthase of PEP-CTERM/exosortase system
MKDFKELMEGFPLYFEIVIANTPELMKKTHQLRYEVFCQEFHFERDEDCPGGLEEDEYDAQALHCLILHRSSELPAGCVRLIHTRQDDPHAPLPIERYCGDCLYPGPTHPTQLPRKSLCEISRLAVSRHFRRRQGESASPVGATQSLQLSSELEIRTFPLISMALFLAVLSMAPLSGRRDSLSVMEPWLARQLRIMGFSFQQIGEIIDYHGARAPFHYSAEQAMADKAQHRILQQLFEVVDPLIQAEARRTGIL